MIIEKRVIIKLSTEEEETLRKANDIINDIYHNTCDCSCEVDFEDDIVEDILDEMQSSIRYII